LTEYGAGRSFYRFSYAKFRYHVEFVYPNSKFEAGFTADAHPRSTSATHLRLDSIAYYPKPKLPTAQPRHYTEPLSNSNFRIIIMAPNQKAKRDVQKLTIEDKPVVSMIDKDGPIVDSPVAIDPGERYPEGPSRQDVRVFTVRLCSPLSAPTPS